MSNQKGRGSSGETSSASSVMSSAEINSYYSAGTGVYAVTDRGFVLYNEAERLLYNDYLTRLKATSYAAEQAEKIVMAQRR